METREVVASEDEAEVEVEASHKVASSLPVARQVPVAEPPRQKKSRLPTEHPHRMTDS